MSRRQPNYTIDEIEVIVSGVEKNSKVSDMQTFSQYQILKLGLA